MGSKPRQRTPTNDRPQTHISDEERVARIRELYVKVFGPD